MSYPTLEQVEAATHYEICKWWRFLPSPGSSAIGDSDREYFDKTLARELKVMDKIKERLDHFGGFTPEISKSLGWER